MKGIVFSLFAISIFSGCARDNPTNDPAVKLNHIAIHVSSLSPSSSFYGDIISLQTIPEPFEDGMHAWYAIGGNAALHIIEGETLNFSPDKMTHLCFSVPDMEAFIDNLNKNKVAFEDWPGASGAITTRPDGVQQIYFQDPDGYWIEVNDDN